MIEKLAYEKLMEEHGLKVADLNEEARIGIKTITDVKRGVLVAEKAGKTVSPDVIKKIRANDRWVCAEILEVVEGREINKDDAAPHTAAEIIKDVTAPAAATVVDKDVVAVDAVGIKIDTDLKKALSEGKKMITSDDLKTISPEAYAIIAKSYEKDGENGLETSFYSLREKEMGIFALNEL